MQQLEFDIDSACEKKRLDVYLTEAQADVSRNFIKKLIEEGRARVNQQPAKANYRVKSGDHVELDIPEPAPLEVEAEDIPLSIQHEDDHLIVIDKPAGLVVHPAPGHPNGTLVNALLFHCNDLKGIGGVERPGIVHRLDKDTSGLIVVAKTDKALVSLQKQFQDRTIKKVYLALAQGHLKPPKGIVRSPIGRHPKDRKKMAAATGGEGRQAETAYEVALSLEKCDLVRLFPKTGRTHQIRVHLASLGHPVLADPLYGGRSKGLSLDLDRQALHAHRLELCHPDDGKTMKFTSPLPADMARFIPNSNMKDI
ncbi:MAG: RluA family pseudouridine synthase [Candidatus Nitronauta litoralis]|uniref:Pseudouridine synthase n=1 Tax=Candidatus Nitronauta litoralis TaxID=2705533 RepID=A0A7T0BW43_9BACT|nr:MAG: RluA family pseudouridine synthase [Candidatus Nitronauta litoralis]